MSRILALSDTPDPDRHDGAGRKNSAWVGNGPLDASGRNCGLGKSRNNKAKESDEDRPAYPNSLNLAPKQGQRDGENALSKRARTIRGCQHVFPQNRRMACEEYSTLS